MYFKICVALLLVGGGLGEKTENEADLVKSTIQTVACTVSKNPWECLRDQASRDLKTWEEVLNEQRNEVLAEADAQVENYIQQRALTGDVVKQKPSQVARNLEAGLGLFSQYLAKSYDKYVNGNTEETRSSYNDGVELGLHAIEINEAREQFEGEGKFGSKLKLKKKKKGKGKGKKGGLEMLLFFGAILKEKIGFFCKAIAIGIQLKFLKIAALSLLVNVARLVILYMAHPPQKKDHATISHGHEEVSHSDWGPYKRVGFEDPHRLAYSSYA